MPLPSSSTREVDSCTRRVADEATVISPPTAVYPSPEIRLTAFFALSQVTLKDAVVPLSRYATSRSLK